MAKKILSDLSAFLNRYFQRNRFPFDKKQLTAYLLCGRMLRAWGILRPDAGSSISSCDAWRKKVQQSVSRNLSTCASATCDQDSPDVMRTGEVANLTIQPGKRYDIALLSLHPEGQRLHRRSLLKKYYSIVA